MPLQLPAPAPWARTAVGIDDAPEGRVAVRVSRRLGRARVERISGTLDPGAAVVAALRQRESFVRWVETPLASPRKARRVLPSLLDVQLPFSIEDCVFDIVDFRTGRAGRGLAAGARTADIERRLQSLESAGLVPHVLDQESLALWTEALAADRTGATDLPRVAIYESADRFTLTVGRGDELLGAHTFKAFDPDTVHRTLRLYFPEAPAALHCVWAGPAARHAPAVRDRHAALAARWPGPLSIPPEPETFLARALAMRAVTAGLLRFDARQGRFRHPAVAARERRAPLRAAAACLAAGLVLCLVNAAWSVAAARRLETVSNALRTAAIRAAGSERLVPKGQERLGAQRAFDERAKLAAPLMAPFGPAPTDAIATVLGAARDEGLRVQALSATRRTITLHATAQTWNQCLRTAQRLEKQGFKAKADRKGEGAEKIPVVLNVEVPYGS